MNSKSSKESQEDENSDDSDPDLQKYIETHENIEQLDLRHQIKIHKYSKRSHLSVADIPIDNHLSTPNIHLILPRGSQNINHKRSQQKLAQQSMATSNQYDQITSHRMSQCDEEESRNSSTEHDFESKSRPSDIKRQSQELVANNLLARKQILIFVISYFTNISALLGLSFEFVTTTFYKEEAASKDNDAVVEISLPDIQVILLTTSIMYFVLGSTLEYIRKADTMIIIVVAFFGFLKIGVGIYDVFHDQDAEFIYLNEIQIVHLIVVVRLAISTIFITGIAKWFSRTYLHLIMGAWFTSEFVSYKITYLLWDYKNIMLIVSGFMLFTMSILIYHFYNLDPIDANLIINEQAINLTSQHTDQFKQCIQVDEFIDELKNSKVYLGAHGNQSQNFSIQRKLLTAIHDYEDKILKRWKIPSMIQTLRINGVLPMMICTCFIFFKYRIMNKFVVIINMNNNHRGLIGCFLLSSEVIQVAIGYFILKCLKGRRHIIQGMLMIIVFIFELLQIVLYSFTDILTYDSDATLQILAISGILVYSLYYMLCICGPTDLAKVEMLKNNMKYVGMLYCVLSGFQSVIQSLFLDEIIDAYLNEDFYSNSSHFYVISSMNIFCTIMAFGSIIGLINKEMKELKTFSNEIRRQTNSTDYQLFMKQSQDNNISLSSDTTIGNKDQHPYILEDISLRIDHEIENQSKKSHHDDDNNQANIPLIFQQ